MFSQFKASKYRFKVSINTGFSYVRAIFQYTYKHSKKLLKINIIVIYKIFIACSNRKYINIPYSLVMDYIEYILKYFPIGICQPY